MLWSGVVIASKPCPPPQELLLPQWCQSPSKVTDTNSVRPATIETAAIHVLLMTQGDHKQKNLHLLTCLLQPSLPWFKYESTEVLEQSQEWLALLRSGTPPMLTAWALPLNNTTPPPGLSLLGHSTLQVPRQPKSHGKQSLGQFSDWLPLMKSNNLKNQADLFIWRGKYLTKKAM